MSGHDLNALVAENVLRWKRCQAVSMRSNPSWWHEDGKCSCGAMSNGAERSLPNFSGDMVSAWLVVEAMARRKTNGNEPWMLTLQNWNYYGDRTYTALFRDCALRNNEVEERASSPSKAICIAALKAIGALTKECEL